MVNVLDASDKILRGDYRLNNFYKLISWKNRYASFNDQEKCVELADASIAIFWNNLSIKTVLTIVPSRNLFHWIEDIHSDKIKKIEQPRKMRQASRSEHSEFFK